jgi:diguanylate cyclase (GGDEF)-like protein
MRVRIWHSVNIVVASLFTVDHLQRHALANVISLAHVCALLPCALALVWLAWSPQYERFYLGVARILVALLGALVAIIVTLALSNGMDEQLASLTVMLFGTFFFAGLMLRQALLAAALTLISFACAAYVAGLPLVLLLKSMTIMTVASSIAAIVYRDVEQSYRRNFLEAALIGELAARDGLSGLMNRRAFDEHLTSVWHRGIRDQRSIALLMIDIDHFKRYNDQWGHQAGDVALRSVALVIHGFARRSLDLAARYGGEEFAVILYDLGFSHAQFLAERLRESVENLMHESEIWTGPEVTVSVGVGFAVPSIRRHPEGLVQLADEALYEAKRAGRNRVIAKGASAYLLLDTGSFNKAKASRTSTRAE